MLTNTGVKGSFKSFLSPDHASLPQIINKQHNNTEDTIIAIVLFMLFNVIAFPLLDYSNLILLSRATSLIKISAVQVTHIQNCRNCAKALAKTIRDTQTVAFGFPQVRPVPSSLNEPYPLAKRALRFSN
jgi:hypothetical protein